MSDTTAALELLEEDCDVEAVMEMVGKLIDAGGARESADRIESLESTNYSLRKDITKLKAEARDQQNKIAHLTEMNEVQFGEIEGLNEQIRTLYSFMDIGQNLDDPPISPFHQSLAKVLCVEETCDNLERMLVEKAVEVMSLLSLMIRDREIAQRENWIPPFGADDSATIQELMNTAQVLRSEIDATRSRKNSMTDCGVWVRDEQMESVEQSGLMRDLLGILRIKSSDEIRETVEERVNILESICQAFSVANIRECADIAWSMKGIDDVLRNILDCERNEIVKKVTGLVDADIRAADVTKIRENTWEVVEKERAKSDDMRQVMDKLCLVMSVPTDRFEMLNEACVKAVQCQSDVSHMCEELGVSASVDSLRTVIRRMSSYNGNLRKGADKVFAVASKYWKAEDATYETIVDIMKFAREKIRKMNGSLRRQAMSCKHCKRVRDALGLDHKASNVVDTIKILQQEAVARSNELLDEHSARVAKLEHKLDKRKRKTSNMLAVVRMQLMRNDFSRDTIIDLLTTIERQASADASLLNGEDIWSFSVDLEGADPVVLPFAADAPSRYRMRVSSSNGETVMKIRGTVDNSSASHDPLRRTPLTLTDRTFRTLV